MKKFPHLKFLIMIALLIGITSLAFAAPPGITDIGAQPAALTDQSAGMPAVSSKVTYVDLKTSALTGTALAETNLALAATYIKGTSAAKPGTCIDSQIRMKTNTAKIIAATIYMEPRPIYVLDRSGIHGASALL